jgi:hypothetical protein
MDGIYSTLVIEVNDLNFLYNYMNNLIFVNQTEFDFVFQVVVVIQIQVIYNLLIWMRFWICMILIRIYQNQAMNQIYMRFRYLHQLNREYSQNHSI